MARPNKAAALRPGDTLRVISPASPADKAAVNAGIAELERLGYRVQASPAGRPEGYFAAPLARRTAELRSALQQSSADGVICARGGYGSSALLDQLRLRPGARPKLLIGFSDVTSLQAYLWQRLSWPTLYAPMVAAGFEKGADRPGGYDRESFLNAASGAVEQWSMPLNGQVMATGSASGTLLGGCLTLVETTLGTPWELDTRGAILLLEDRALKPYQLDRLLLHLAQAGKFRGVRGFVLGDFPESEPPPGNRVTVRDVFLRILGPLDVPIVFGAAVGHTARSMLTMPLGVRVRLHAQGAGTLDVLEAPVARAQTTRRTT
jgi:muramoyltetrapeptide carboxypeptidase